MVHLHIGQDQGKVTIKDMFLKKLVFTLYEACFMGSFGLEFDGNISVIIRASCLAKKKNTNSCITIVKKPRKMASSQLNILENTAAKSKIVN